MFVSGNSVSFYEKSVYSDAIKMRGTHFHDKHELYYLASGSVKYFIDNEIFLLEPGDMIFVQKNTFHKTDYGDDNYAVRDLFTFDDNELGEDVQRYIDALKDNIFIKIKHEKLHEVQDIIKKIEKEDEGQNDDCKFMQKLYFKLLLVMISRFSMYETRTKKDKSYIIAQNIAKYISKNPSGDLSLETLSDHFSMSKSYISRFFKTMTGVGLNEYISITRVTHAEKLLLATDMSITEIASKCGFNDSNYFAAVFKRLKGITPKKYALMNKK